MNLLNNFLNMTVTDKLFYGIGITFITIISVFAICMFVHIVNNPELISFGGF